MSENLQDNAEYDFLSEVKRTLDLPPEESGVAESRPNSQVLQEMYAGLVNASNIPEPLEGETDAEYKARIKNEVERLLADEKLHENDTPAETPVFEESELGFDEAAAPKSQKEGGEEVPLHTEGPDAHTKENPLSNHESSQSKSGVEGFVERAGSWMEKNIPEWAQAAFWGIVRTIGKVVRAILFGDERTTDRMATSFQRTMQAEEYKAKHGERQKAAHEEAQERGQEASQEASAAQRARGREDAKEHENGRDGASVGPTESPASSAPPDPHKVARDTISAMRFNIADDAELKNIGVIKLTKLSKDGSEKDCYVPEALLSETDPRAVKAAVNEAASIAAAQRFFDHKNYTIIGVNDEKFVLESQKGTSFAYDRDMLKEDLKTVSQLFREAIKQDPSHKEAIAEDMKKPLTATTVNQMIEEKKDRDTQEAAATTRTETSEQVGSHEPENPASHEAENTDPNDHKIAGAEPVAVYVDAGLGSTEILTKEVPTEVSPADALRKLGYDITEQSDVDRLVAASPDGTIYVFDSSLPVVRDPELFDRVFKAMDKLGVPSESEYESSYSPSFRNAIGEDLDDVFAGVGLLVAADEHSDSLYVFACDENGTKIDDKSWILSQTLLAEGDATDLAKIIFEVNSPDLVNDAIHSEADTKIVGVIMDEVSAAAKAAQIVATAHYFSDKGAEQGAMAFANIATETGPHAIFADVDFPEEAEVPSDFADPGSVIRLTVEYENATASAFIDTTGHNLASNIINAGNELSDSMIPTKDDCMLAVQYMLEPAAEADHLVGQSMISAKNINFDPPELQPDVPIEPGSQWRSFADFCPYHSEHGDHSEPDLS